LPEDRWSPNTSGLGLGATLAVATEKRRTVPGASPRSPSWTQRRGPEQGRRAGRGDLGGWPSSGHGIREHKEHVACDAGIFPAATFEFLGPAVVRPCFRFLEDFRASSRSRFVACAIWGEEQPAFLLSRASKRGQSQLSRYRGTYGRMPVPSVMWGTSSGGKWTGEQDSGRVTRRRRRRARSLLNGVLVILS
jgi:hypothetical protein